ncbi:MAG: hypothetical protein QNJ40_18375 [Xanthomonadales bacterium]|nr:hypothetical protein [Xanthomonadales bacterium]
MDIFPRLVRAVAKAKFRLMGLATIRDVPTDQFNALLQSLVDAGWQPQSAYSGVDAWIDYGRVVLKKGPKRLKFEWDNWTEGSIEGRKAVVTEFAAAHDLTVVNEWRWSEYDHA